MNREIKFALAKVIAAREGLNSDDPSIVAETISQIASAVLDLDAKGIKPEWQLEQICDLALDLEIEDPLSESYNSKLAALKALVKEV